MLSRIGWPPNIVYSENFSLKSSSNLHQLNFGTAHVSHRQIIRFRQHASLLGSPKRQSVLFLNTNHESGWTKFLAESPRRAFCDASEHAPAGRRVRPRRRKHRRRAAEEGGGPEDAATDGNTRERGGRRTDEQEWWVAGAAEPGGALRWGAAPCTVLSAPACTGQ